MSKNQDASIGFIGGGNMAQAIIRGLLAAGHPADNIAVSDPSDEQCKAIIAIDKRIALADDNLQLSASADALVLAVKPQIMAKVAESLAAAKRPAEQVIVSVAAGITLESMQSWFGESSQLVRVMPNQPSLVGEGMSGLCANSAASAAARELAGYVMAATGKASWFAEEQLMDAVTAVSGSGPAYFYLVMEIMAEVAVEFGFDAETARELSVQTALGAATVADQSTESLETLRERVTSPGGTTAAALNSLEDAGIRAMFRAALTAARDRSIELGKG